ncbi:hypothetical protein [Flavobacterium seoulense]|uniref:Uncharacterized protein n=1 Tax=Flavobacterium seoulense TaxID=1492738 RepID=A0A066WN38_9FLAO|nr:hypothetical protein [Flavobacterium seoulense]KDN54018.1 hypothetical protein FEM21_28350 [Flavobacterium seoulense]
MELDDLKSDWNKVQPNLKTDEAMLLLLQENKHPVLKSIRKQIGIEITAWLVFLLSYYWLFDGAKKPFWINLILVISLGFPIFHSFYGYHFNKYLSDGANVKKALEQVYYRLKKYAVVSVISRVGFICGLLVFFSYGIQFTTTKYYSLAVICFVFLIQLWVLYLIWNQRLKRIRQAIVSFNVDK